MKDCWYDGKVLLDKVFNNDTCFHFTRSVNLDLCQVLGHIFYTIVKLAVFRFIPIYLLTE